MSTFVPQAPRPPSQCVTSPTQALLSPSQVPLVEAFILPETAVDDATAAEAEVPADVLGAAAVGVAAVAPTALGRDAVVDVPKNSAA